MRSVDELVRATNSGRRVKYLFFWGHQPQRDGGIGASCLSQWFPAEFVVDGLAFATAEHYMMWRKARLFDDQEAAERILAARHPREAKLLGGRVRGFDEQVWERERFAIVTEASVQKFGQQKDMQTFLTGTANRVLVEASPTDRIWGIGLAATDERAGNPSRWRGLNLLGFALMAARDNSLMAARDNSLMAAREDLTSAAESHPDPE
ncbi:NADAR family protein [Actinoplanes sp. TFC3]|uniref:NADAR family protein n=1 Tax=Actinoplanes sp. TFC3 TaxID=1710355 RepID=UPI00082BCB88|nr:NADAR family protein [Actinoplanes sp. TFC3]